MRIVFADALYYIALLQRRDNCHERAAAFATARDLRLVTSDAILMEVLAFVAGRGRRSREIAVRMIDMLRGDPGVHIVRQTPELFDEAFALYRQRADKGYSLTDCMSMNICRAMDIKEVLTHDHHFAQEGFAVLL